MRLTFLFALSLFSFTCLSQVRTLTGKLVDSKSKEPVPNAIVLVSGTTSGTISNYLGYFQIDIAKNYNELVISHIGYNESKITIPQADHFTIELQPSAYLLRGLDLTFLGEVLKNAPKVNLSVPMDTNAIGQNAQYADDWSEFYSDLVKVIQNNRSFRKDEFYTEAIFTVNEKGQVENVSFTDQEINQDVIKASLKKLDNWTPAVQNDILIGQRFLLPVYYSPRVKSNAWEKSVEDISEFVLEHFRLPFTIDSDSIELTLVIKEGYIRSAEIKYAFEEEWKKKFINIEISNSNKLKGLDKRVNKVKLLIPSSEMNVAFISPGKNAGENKDNAFDHKPAQFPGGKEKLESYIKKYIRKIKEPIPPNSIGSKVHLNFTVDKEGTIKDVIVIKSLGEIFDREAVSIYENMPRWSPAKYKGKPVEKSYNTSVYFGKENTNRIFSAERKFKRGVKLFKKGQNDKAIKLFTKAIKKNPTVSNYYFNRAAAYFEKGDLESACSDWKYIKDYDQDALSYYQSNCDK